MGRASLRPISFVAFSQAPRAGYGADLGPTPLKILWNVENISGHIGLGAMGQAGVTKALEVMHKELDTTMALCGHRDINYVTRDILYVPEDFEGRWA